MDADAGRMFDDVGDGLATPLSVVIPTYNAAARLELTLAALGPVREIIIVDGGSRDGTAVLAQSHGVCWLTSARGRGIQLRHGGTHARGDWLLFLHADTVLAHGWREAVAGFIGDDANRDKAAVFRFALDDAAPEARRLEAMVAWRVRWLGLPYGDQGLLIRRAFYDALGGYQPLPLMEDVALIRAIGPRRFEVLDVAATTSASRYRADGWLRRSGRNILCLALYFCGVPPRLIVRIYG
jgi:rSAM/selenodomain-associated transferase 2